MTSRTSAIVVVRNCARRVSVSCLLAFGALLGGGLLVDAPNRTARRGTPSFDRSMAIAGTVLLLAWAGYHVRRFDLEGRIGLPADVPAAHRLAVRAWAALVLCVAVFMIGVVLRLPVKAVAPLAWCCDALAFRMLWRTGCLALTLQRNDPAGLPGSLRWWGLLPATVTGPLLAFLLLGDSWATMALGSASCGTAIWIAGHRRHAPRLSIPLEREVCNGTRGDCDGSR